VARFATRAALAASAWAATAHAQVASPAPETIAVGDWQIDPLLELRARGEYRHDVDGRDRSLLVERSRLGFDALRGVLEARVVLQDARGLSLPAGAEAVAGPAPVDVTGPHEAWGEVHTRSDRPSFVRVGRQAVVWGEGRLLGTADWSPAGRSLDAARGRLVVGGGAFELLAAALTDVPPGATLQAYGELFGGRAEWALDPLLALEAYGLARFAQASPQVNLESTVLGETYTGALRLHGDAHAWTWGAEAAYQLGHARALGLNRNAWAAAAHVAHTFERVLLMPTVRVGIAYASGDSGSSRVGAFDPLLPDVHTWHGAMDLFAWSNEAEMSARVAVAPWAEAVAAVEYRYARLAEPGGTWRTGYLATIGSAPGNTSGDLGHEIDATLTWSPWVPVEIGAGYAALLLGSGARAILAANQVGSLRADGTLATSHLSHLGTLQLTLRMP
jgi:Alginate export